MLMILDNLSEPSSMSVLPIVPKELKFLLVLKEPLMVVFPSLTPKKDSQDITLMPIKNHMTQKLTEREFSVPMLINIWNPSNLMLKTIKNNSENGMLV